MLKTAVNIGKAVRAALVSTAALAFVFSGLLCCCLAPPSHAKTQAVKVPSCHAHKADQAKKQESKTCDCCKIAKNDTSKSGLISELVQSMDKSFKVSFSTGLFPRISHQFNTFHLAYQGPPRTDNPLAIYLQNSSLRL